MNKANSSKATSSRSIPQKQPNSDNSKMAAIQHSKRAEQFNGPKVFPMKEIAKVVCASPAKPRRQQKIHISELNL
jgi:hypothetical protein